MLRAVASAALIVLCAASIAGCSPKDATRAGAAPLENDDVHFFRHSNEQAVFRVSKTLYCVVADPSQMEAFGGFAQVRVVPPSVDFKRGKKAAAGGYCASP